MDGNAPGEVPTGSPFAEDPEVGLRIERAFEARDLRSVAWIWLQQLTSELSSRNGATAASWARLILNLGEEPAGEDDVREEAAVVGSILHGIPPRDDRQWALAEEIFDPQTMRDIRSWGRALQSVPGTEPPDDAEAS